MTDIREVCAKCQREFAPLSSARGEEATTCSNCLFGITELKLEKKKRKNNINLNKHSLFKGCEAPEDVELLFLLTRIESPEKKQAMLDHLCKGLDAVSAQAFNGISQPKFSETLKRLNDVAQITGELLERKLAKFRAFHNAH